ncbi:MAG TPA: molybdopterin-dependent oxidoreductase [Nitrososphaerales archaeon]|nr:molybdopterin-dependent oxidoreductase [Nitrososphaerales archaeon]
MKTVGTGKVRSACSLCQNFCGLIAYVEDGRIVKLEGDPGNPRNHGHLCAKGLSGFMNAYSPKRVPKPLIRTNPEKKLGVDPKWKEISWEEAIDLVTDKLKKAKDRGEAELGHKLSGRPSNNLSEMHPWSQRIIFDTFDHWSSYSGIQMSWLQALDAYQCILSAECYCGNAVHPPSYLNTSTFEVTVDPEYSKYVLLVGAQAGSIINYDTMNVARHIAENRPGGIKVVSVDPMAGYAGSKAEEWVPIRPGTDAAFLLALINLLVNELKIYDEEFLRNKTNAPYLVREEDGLYARDVTSHKPLVWDAEAKCPKPFDATSSKSVALEGSYVVNGVSCKTGFSLVKEHLLKYTPEYSSQITSIPADTIRRIAAEIGDAACIGQTITIDGKEFPYRPVSVAWYRGLSAHRHSYLAGLAAIMLPTILGAIQVPGGICGHPPNPEYVSPDGLMGTISRHGPPYPAREASRPQRVDAFELFPVSVYSHHLLPLVLNNPQRFGIDVKSFVWPEIMFIFRDNPVNNTYSPQTIVEGLSKIPFIVSLCVDLDETANSLADVVLPDLHHLEKLGEGLYMRINEPGYWYGAKPVVRPPFEPPWDQLVNNGQILLLIAEKAKFLPELYQVINRNWKLAGTPYELKTDRKYTYEEIIDSRLKTWLGQDKGLEWLMSDDGGLIVWKAKPEEKYKGASREGRLHVYYEFMLRAKESLDKTVKEIGLDWWDTSDYQPIPDWKPCPAYSNKDDEYNLYLINYKIPIMAHSFGRFNPVPMQLVQARRHLDSVLIHPETATRLGIREGDTVQIEDKKGRKKQVSVAHLTERIHPEVIASSQHRLKNGLNFNEFATLEEDTMDFVSAAVDACILVRISKKE